MVPDASAIEQKQSPQEAALDPARYLPVGHDFQSITNKIGALVLERPIERVWLAGVGASTILALILAAVITYIILKGVGLWGINVPVGWCFAITSFVWWIGIGHAGTLISAILLLLHQKWRTSINRIAEAMTIFAVMCAGIFPLLHMGRPWYFFWLLPYPNTMRLWPQFRSALIWDVFAVSTYFTVSLLFWYMGMIPDLATLRDRAVKRRWQMIYGFFALGWRNSARHWHRYEMAYLLLGGLATPLVISVHSVVSSDFAISVEPGWHETVFPPYFVAGALLSGFAMVLAICIPLRHFYQVQDFITLNHLEVMAKILLATSYFTSYGYFSEQFITWIAGEAPDRYVYWNILVGFKQYAMVTWITLFCVFILPQLLWIPRVRRNEKLLFVICIVVLAGMWMERYLLITTTLSRDFLPSSWGIFQPTVYDILTYVGTLGVFMAFFLLFCRFLPMISMSEMRALVPGSQAHEEGR
jgi:Ni/Fe-hydrogenase subunit HybB-like protein